MKTKVSFLIIVLISIFTINTVKAQASLKTIKIQSDFDCASCKGKIERSLIYEKGVKTVDCNVESETVVITYKATKNSKENLTAALTNLGYDVKNVSEIDSKEVKKNKKDCATKKKKSCCDDK